jgi:aminoglycoside phosphotransferase family enzyme
MHIRDIQDEMNIVKTMVKQQEGVIDQLSRAISAFHQNSRHRHWKSNGDELANTSPVGGSVNPNEIEEEQDMKVRSSPVLKQICSQGLTYSLMVTEIAMSCSKVS